MLIDSHCHLQEFEDLQAVVSSASKAGITDMICAGADLESSKQAIEIANKFPNVWATAGIHPEENSKFKILRSKEVLKSKLLKLLKQTKVVAVGECGLDYQIETRDGDREKQRELLKLNIDLARDTGLPLVVHCRNAFNDVFEIVDLERVQMHCFTGNMEQMQECVRRGWYISFGGIVTFKNSHELREVAKMVPEDKLLVETDSPYLAPEPVRGTRNEPKNVKIVAEVLAKTKSVTFEKIDEITTENAIQLFNIPLPA